MLSFILKNNKKRLSGATLLIFANKQDIAGALTSEEIKDLLDLDKIVTHHWVIVGCSAVTGERLVDGIDWLVNDIASRIFTLN
jgi:ADP-ribosylation factor-like protein 2